MGKGVGVGVDGITKLKTNVISAAAEKKQCLLLGEVCLAACSGEWVQYCLLLGEVCLAACSGEWGQYWGMTLLLNVFCLCSCQTQRCSVCTGKRSRKNGMDCMGKLVPVNTVVQFYVHIDICRQATSAMTAGQGCCDPHMCV